MMTDIIHTPGDHDRYHRWKAHLKNRGATIPTKEDFLVFGSLSTVERLRPLLVEMEPENASPIRLAISAKRAERRARNSSKAKGGRRGPALTCSIPPEALPIPWKGTLGVLRQRLAHKEVGGIDFYCDSKLKPMPKSSLSDAEYILRAIAKSCEIRGKEPSLTIQSTSYWINDAEARGCGQRGLSCQIGTFKRFILHHEGVDSEFAKILGRLRGDYIERGRLTDKRKDDITLADLCDLGKVWDQAEALFQKAQKSPRGGFQRYKLFLDAVAIAMPVVVPLRISDLHRIEIGTHLRRDAIGWSLHIRTQKTNGYYHRDELWPELTPYLDALLSEDAPGGDLWAGYKEREGTPIFSRDGGKTGLSGDWISDVWFEHFRCGEHFVRTLWHESVFDEDSEMVWVALALNGQKSRRIAKEYRRKESEKRQQIKGRQTMKAKRKRLQNVDIGF